MPLCDASVAKRFEEELEVLDATVRLLLDTYKDKNVVQAKKRTVNPDQANAYRRFHTATKTDLKCFISTAQIKTPVESDEFDSAVVALQKKALRLSHEKYIRSQKGNKHLKGEAMDALVEETYQDMYARSFDTKYLPLLVKAHIQYALSELQTQVATKIEKRLGEMGVEKAKELTTSLQDDIGALGPLWNKTNPLDSHVLQQYFEKRALFFKQIKRAS